MCLFFYNIIIVKSNINDTVFMLLYISAGATTSHKVAGKDKGTSGLNLLETVSCSLTWFDREAWHDITWSGIFGSFHVQSDCFYLHIFAAKKKKKESMHEHVMSKSVVKGVMHDCGVFGKQMTTFP